VDPAQHGGLAQSVGEVGERGQRHEATTAGIHLLVGGRAVAREVIGDVQRLEASRAQRVEGLAPNDAA